MPDETKIVFDTVDDLVSSFLYYDRKEDEDLPVGRVQELIQAGVITVDQIVERFRRGLRERG